MATVPHDPKLIVINNQEALLRERLQRERERLEREAGLQRQAVRSSIGPSSGRLRSRNARTPPFCSVGSPGNTRS
jgi:hypothetical protein